jgi:dephospho-CoA kinase
MKITNLPLRIGLTGGIGSGKTTVARMLQLLGAIVIDADAIARTVTAPNGSAMPAISQTFGVEFITPDGGLDRERMRTHVFSQPQAKQSLEAIIHPLVAQETQQQAQAAIATGCRNLVFDVPLLVEAGERWRSQVDRILVVDCLEETQIQRVITRNGLTREAVQRILSAQTSRLQKLAAADWVIFNDGISLETLENHVKSLPIQAG